MYKVVLGFEIQIIIFFVFRKFLSFFYLRKSRNRLAKLYKPESSTKELQIRKDVQSGFDSVNEGYEELGDLHESKNSTYDTLQ